MERHWNTSSDGVTANLKGVAAGSQTFPIHQPCSLPVPFATLPLASLLQQQWIKDLQEILTHIPRNRTVSVVTSNYKYREVLLNWLISAKTRLKPPLSSVIALSLDKETCSLLKKSNIPCVFAPTDAFFTKHEDIAVLEGGATFTEILVLRVTAIRLMNHWGYNVANYDTDAVILRNPDSLYSKYKDSDMVASYGIFPFELKEKWGATMCGGVFMIRSTPHSGEQCKSTYINICVHEYQVLSMTSEISEHFWESVSQVNVTSTMLRHNYDDQARLNYGLAAMRPSWDKHGNVNVLYRKLEGETAGGFKVTIASGKEICRHYCSLRDRSKYYVWHKGGGPNGVKEKEKFAQQGQLWYLRKDWEKRTNSSTSLGMEWLREMSV